jgi:surfactin synthase thioesterase subunit
MTAAQRAPATPRGRWWTVLSRPAEAHWRLLLFPHSGAGPYALRPLVAAAGPGAEVLGLTLPGREYRLTEPPCTDPDEVAASVEAEIAPLAPLRTILFGCSMGALLAARVAEHFAGLCSELIIAGQSPGDGPRSVDDAVEEPDLLRLLAAAGGVSAALLEDAQLRQGLLARLSADLRLGARAGRGFGQVRVPAPITVLGGLSDPLVSPACLDGWAAHTGQGARVLLLEGGHFAFLAERHQKLIAELLAPLGTGRRVRLPPVANVQVAKTPV